LATAGVVVLQVNTCPIIATPEEGPCNVGGYEAAVNQLANEGMIDPDRVGIIGFSRTCFYVMETLTTGRLHISAASITDGVMMDYYQYLNSSDIPGNAVAKEYDAIIGGRPFGAGLDQWRKHSPLFNIEKVNAPLLIVGEGPNSLLSMWGPYAALRHLNKPTDLVLLNSDEHVLTNPAVRLASQGGSVDWFRFWLQDYEDPDPAKADQYKRWRELRVLQQAKNSEPGGTGASSPTPH
jgi:poly(3-hydroxybutyrate) depolymerase